MIKILIRLEEYRKKLESGQLIPGCHDHTVRMCEAIVASEMRYKNRAEWLEEIRNNDN